MPRGGFLEIDEASRANLELLRTLQGGNKKGSLLGVLDRTCTGMGARKLARWLIAPLADQASIDARLDAVEELFPRAVWRDELCALLSGIGDLERLCARLTLGVGNARDLRALGQSLLALPKLASSLASARAPLLQGLCGPLEALGSLGEQLDQAILEEPKATLKDGGLFKGGFDAELDGLLSLSTSGKDLLLQIEARERTRTGISSLKVRYNKVFGYYLEITRANLDRVPADYIRKQTTVGAERFVTPELKDHEEKVLSAEERAASLEFTLYEALRQRVISQARQVRAAAEAVALCDTLVCFARCAAEYRYVRPVVDDSGVIDIIEGRHPVVERMIGAEPFVPNDVRLDRADAQLLILTGPNMAGKSTVMRQVALITVMAQAGCFVPAQSARIGLCDRVFTRVGAADNLARGQSTFMVEMSETANILHHATARSLVILDEIGRGTSTFDGLSIAWAVAEHLHDRVGARTLFATHYHELVDLAREKARVKNRSIAVQELNGKVLFLRKLVEGGASRSYGIEVARLAGLPGDVLCRAREILANLESGELDQDGHPRPARRAPHPAPSDSQLGLFAPATRPVDRVEQQLVGELREVSLDHLSPLEALNLLFAWKQRL